MPKPKQHQEKAEHNRKFLTAISNHGPADWMAIAAFYTAVHLVEMLRAYKNEHSQNHDERNIAVRKDHRPIQVPYHELFNVSLIARYSTKSMIDNYLSAIEKYVANESEKVSAGGTP